MNDLKPCPLCGGSNLEVVNTPQGYFIDCSCGCFTGDFETEAEAIDAWNTRVERTYATGGIIAQAECHNTCASISEFTCSACGFNCDLTSWISLFDGDSGRHRHHHFGTPNYCPNCGAKVVDC